MTESQWSTGTAGVLVVMFHEGINLALEIRDRVEGAATDRLVGNQCEPALDLIQPRTVGGREVQMKARAARQPCLHSSMLVGAVVVADQVHIEVLRDIGLDVAQEGQELLVAMLGLALREHGAIGDVQGCKQRGGAMADVVVRDALDIAQAHGQHRLSTLERLTLAFLVHTQHH
jgi:hypothetical protein